MEQISKANGTRRSNYVAKVLPDWKYNATARDPEDMSEDSEELPRPKGKADAKEKAAKRLPRRLAPSLEGCRWTTWSHVSRPFTPNNEVGTLMPLQFNLWEEKRIFSPNRSWPTRPKNPKVAAAPQFYDQQREGLPFWKAVTWKHQGQIFSDPPPFKKRPRSAAQRRAAGRRAAGRLFEMFTSRGQCLKGAACNFAHGKEELQSMPVEARTPVGRRKAWKAGMEAAMKIKVQSPSDAISQMQLLQMKMNQLESLSMHLAVLHPPPGLEVPPMARSVDGCTVSADGDVRSVASSFSSSSPVDEPGSEGVSPLSQRSYVFWL
ncbi:unnamed protein product [Cladocopium goreaui]|uniref:Ubiquitin-like modifier-activating enzyme 5 n=1 Tax=Cladocopium goreaui TaxID=2562237 RepID=A0A9P1C9T8_9DINO|nr:unnamed protein product [Cladocopium goreaui]